LSARRRRSRISLASRLSLISGNWRLSSSRISRFVNWTRCSLS
jgi:hypothetical protein